MLTTGSCDRHGAAWEKLEIAENLMDSKPDSALAVLEGIPASKVKGKEISARYALLKSMALDKNCIDTTTFDILQPAIDYLLHMRSHSKFFYLLNISELSILKNVTANDLETSYILFLSQLCNIQRTL